MRRLAGEIWGGFDHFRDDVAHQSLPSFGFGQLWRSCQSCQDSVQTLANIGHQGFDLIAGGMGQGQQ